MPPGPGLTALLLLTIALPVAHTQEPAAPVPGLYQVGPGDILEVTVYGYDDLNQTVVVQPDGTFPFPLVGRVEAEDLTVSELQQSLERQLASGFVRNPHVAVVVKEYRSKRVFVVGEVTRPGPYPLAGKTTIVELLALAGPLTANAGTEIVVVRPGSQADGPTLPDAAAATTRAEVLRIDLRDLQSGDLSKNLVLEPNDTLFVSPAPRVYVSGEVRQPGAFPFSPGMTVRQLIGLAGGLSEDGSTRGLRVIREVEGRAKEMKVRFEDPIQPGDTVVVKAKLF
jgi:polysaccharide export outer membrane protein